VESIGIQEITFSFLKHFVELLVESQQLLVDRVCNLVNLLSGHLLLADICISNVKIDSFLELGHETHG